MNRYAKIAAELAEIRRELRRLAAETSPTKDGAKSLFEAYKKEHPGSKKTVKDFYQPEKGDKKKAPSKEVVAEVSNKLDEIESKVTQPRAMRGEAIGHLTSPKVLSKYKAKAYDAASKSLSKDMDSIKDGLNDINPYLTEDETYDKVKDLVMSKIKEGGDDYEISDEEIDEEAGNLADKFSKGLVDVAGDAYGSKGVKTKIKEMSDEYKRSLTDVESKIVRQRRRGIKEDFSKALSNPDKGMVEDTAKKWIEKNMDSLPEEIKEKLESRTKK